MGFINISSAIRRPFTDFSKLFVGAILIVIPVLNFFSIGFLFDCLKKGGELPRWRLAVFIDGLKAFLVVIVYMLPFLLVFSLSYLLEIGQESILLAPLLIIGLLSFYFVPAGLVIFARTGSLVKGVKQLALSREYFFAFWIGMLWAVGLNSISIALFSFLHLILPLSLFFIITALVSLVLSFAAQITFLTLITGAYESQA